MGPLRARVLITAVLLAPALPVDALAQAPKALCRQACDVANLPASCSWMATKPKRCLRRAVKACVVRIRQGLATTCEPTDDFPPCLTNHGCPFGTLCTDTRCQVVSCTTVDPTTCSGDRMCLDGTCIVADCRRSDQNCPSGFVCTPTDALSGTCQPSNPSRRACATDTTCSLASSVNPRCLRGICAAKKRRRRCEADGDCFEACKTGRSSARLAYCDAASRCVCANCESTTQCAARFSCEAGSVPACRSNGACRCPAPPSSSSGGRGVCTTFESPACTPCDTDADCGGFDLCLQSASCG